MADYIYLLQNRLTPAQWRAVEAVREAARAHGMPVFLVGGAVRDLTTGTPVRDLDFAVQGDVAQLLGDLEQAGAQVVGRNEALSSVYLTLRGGVRAEIGPTLSVTYPKPGLATAQAAAILDDLRRRDFTANAMAVSLNEGSYGLLLDPLNGTADIENRELRLVSAYGFIENPALLLRAARLSERLGWTLEERTSSRYQNSKEEGHLDAISAGDRGYELEEIFHEEDPISLMEHLAGEGWLEKLFAALRPGDADRNGIEGVRDLMGQLEGQQIHPDPSAVYFPLLTAKMQDKDRAALKAAFVRPGFVERIDTIEARAKELGAQLTSKAAAPPSETWRLLKDAEPDLVLWLAVHTRTGAVQSKIKAFLKDWPQMRQKLPYALMQEMRITPDLPGYDQLLDDLFFALIDGKLETTEATRAFLEPFSPPAPPQVTVRRRPAKAARRGRKAAIEEVAVESPDEDEDDAERERGSVDSEDTEERSEDDDESGSEDSGPDSEEDEGGDSSVAEAVAPAREEVAPEPRAAEAPETSIAALKGIAKKVSAKAEPQAAKHAAPAKKIVEEKRAAPAPPSRPAKAAAKPAKAVAPAKKVVAKKAAPAKVAAKAVPAKKGALTKSAPVKTQAKVAAKKVMANKSAVAKKVAVKAPVKAQTAVKGRAVAKKGAPVKAAKKVAAKARGRR